MNLPERMDVIRWLYEHLKQKRFLHILGVEEYSLHLASIYQVDPRIVSLSALLHDCAKQIPEEDLRKILKKNHESQELILAYPQLYHAFAAPYVAQEVFGELPNEVLNAIRYHSTGHVPMTTLEKIIFSADFAEPTRNGYDQLVTARQLLEKDLDQGAYYICKETNGWLVEQGKSICPLSLQTCDYLKEITHGKSTD